MPNQISGIGPWFSELERALRIDPHELDEALIQQSELLYKISKELVEAISVRDAAKQAFAEAESNIDNKIRHDAAVDEEKITEKVVESRKLLDSKLIGQRDSLLRLANNVGKMDALRTAYHERGRMLSKLVDLHVSGWFGDVTAKSAHGRERDANVNRARDLRKQRGPILGQRKVDDGS